VASEDLEALRAVFERWNAGDRTIDMDTVDPGIELHTPMATTRGGPYRGHDGVRQWLADIDDQFEVWELQVDEWRELDGGRILGLGAIHAKGRGSGVELDQPLAWLFTFRDGKVTRYDAFYSHAEGLSAAGLE
jgi:ketosteroid isomerase-like protein